MSKKYEIVEKLGQGCFGTTYKIKIDSKYYVLKKEKFIKSEINNFNKFINKINTTHFDKLYSYKISKDNFKQILPSYCNINLPPTQAMLIQYLKGTRKSNYCLETITDLKDGTAEFMNKNNMWTNINEFRSMIIQIIYALYLMHSNDFYHRDLHDDNIIYKYVYYNQLILVFIINLFKYLITIFLNIFKYFY